MCWDINLDIHGLTWASRVCPIYRDIYFVLPSASDILRYILSCRAIAIYDLPINLRYIYKRVSPLITMRLWHCYGPNWDQRWIIWPEFPSGRSVTFWPYFESKFSFVDFISNKCSPNVFVMFVSLKILAIFSMMKQYERSKKEAQILILLTLASRKR